MDGFRTREGQALERTAKMLIALAALADLACCRSPAIRSLVLCILRPAEYWSRDYALRETCHWGVVVPDLPELADPDGDSVDYAVRLADSFRNLAALLTTLAIVIETYCAEHVAQSSNSIRTLCLQRANVMAGGLALVFRSGLSQPYPDTS